MTPQNGNLPNNAAATSVPDKNLAGLEVYGNQEEKTWEEEPGRIGSLWKSRGKTWEDWKSRGICSKRKCFHCVGGLEVYGNQEETGPRKNTYVKGQAV